MKRVGKRQYCRGCGQYVEVSSMTDHHLHPKYLYHRMPQHFAKGRRNIVRLCLACHRRQEKERQPHQKLGTEQYLNYLKQTNFGRGQTPIAQTRAVHSSGNSGRRKRRKGRGRHAFPNQTSSRPY